MGWVGMLDKIFAFTVSIWKNFVFHIDFHKVNTNVSFALNSIKNRWEEWET